MDSLIEIYVDLEKEKFTFKRSQAFFDHLDVSLIFETTDELFFDNLKFDISISNTEYNKTESFPPPGIKYEATQGGTFQRAYFEIKRGIDYKLEISLQNAGKFLKDSMMFKADIPESINAGWIWDGNQWQSPIPYPTDGKLYIWNNDEKNWVLGIQPEVAG